MIDVLHLYVGAGVARVVCAAAADNERTNEERSTAGGRVRSTNPVVSHLPIEIRCNLYWLCITEHRIAFVRPHYRRPAGARPMDRPAISGCILPTYDAAPHNLWDSDAREWRNNEWMNDDLQTLWTTTTTTGRPFVTESCSVLNDIVNKSFYCTR